MRAILVSVEYSDLLALTLPYSRHHFSQVVIVTSPDDYPNVKPIALENHADVFVTNLFYTNGATFNKWAALEAGLDWMGREGWLAIMDADVRWPRAVERIDGYATPGCLYGPLRRMQTDLTGGPLPEDRWSKLPIHRNITEWAGYTQIFHASDPHLGPPPWHEINWGHAGGADSMFQRRWPKENKVRLPFEVLHLGPAGTNWYGRQSDWVGGGKPDKAEERNRKLRQMLNRRRRNRVENPHDPYCGEKLHG